MNRVTSICIILAVIGLILTGCGPKADNIDNTGFGANQSNNNKPGFRGDGNGSNQWGADRQFGFMRADLTGEVVSVSENEITLKVIEMPSFEGGPDQRREMRQQEGLEQGNENSADGSQQPGNDSRRRQRITPEEGADNRNGKIGQPPPQGDNQGRRRFSEGDGSMPRWTPNYTGETKTITIPEGMSVTRTVMGENGREVRDIKLEELKQGDILQVWYSEEDSNVISRVSAGDLGIRPN